MQVAEQSPDSGEVEQLRQELQQLRCLYRLTDVVSRARSLPEIYGQALDSLAMGLGARRASILLFDTEGVMRFVAQRGLSRAYCEAVEGHSPWDQDTYQPAPLLVEDVRHDRSLEGYRALFDREGIRALGFFPLSYGDRLLGKFMVYYAEPHPFSAAEVELALSIAQHVAVAVDRAMTEQERQRTGELLKFLGDASAILPQSLDHTQTAEHMARALIPAIADHCVVDIVGEDGRLQRLAEAASDPEKERRLRELRRFPVEGRPSPALEAVKRGQTVVVSQFDVEQLTKISGGNREYLELVSELGVVCALSIPLLARERVAGVITCGMSSSGRRFEAERIRTAEEFGRRAALAIENARLYAAEREARERAESATRSREDMLAVVSHDLRNPLSAITTSAALLFELSGAEANDKVRRRIDTIQRAALRMDRLIQDLLDLSRIDARTLALELAEQRCEGLVAQALELMLPVALDAGHVLEGDVRCPDALVVCDRDRVYQVFSNLIGNAIKFTPAGGQIRVEAELEPGAVHFVVADTGPGIGNEELPRLFDRYWQAARVDRRGVGLGLSIAHGLVVAHGGRVWAESERGAGTRVHFTLPTPP